MRDGHKGGPVPGEGTSCVQLVDGGRNFLCSGWEPLGAQPAAASHVGLPIAFSISGGGAGQGEQCGAQHALVLVAGVARLVATRARPKLLWFARRMDSVPFTLSLRTGGFRYQLSASAYPGNSDPTTGNETLTTCPCGEDVGADAEDADVVRRKRVHRRRSMRVGRTLAPTRSAARPSHEAQGK